LYKIVRWSLSNRPVIVLFALILMGGGVVSAFRINQELLPSVEFPAVFILVPEPGASPEQVDRDVTQPLITGLSGLPRARHITTSSSQGFSQVSIDFDLDSSLKDDLDAVNRRMPQIQLPGSAGKPVVQTFNFSAVPTMTYSLAAKDGDLVRATNEANDVILPALNGAKGAAQIKVSGGDRRQVFVTLDGQKLAARGISVQQVQEALTGAQIDLPAGETLQADKTLPVDVLSTVRTLDDLNRLAVGSSPGAGSTGPASGAAGAAAAGSGTAGPGTAGTGTAAASTAGTATAGTASAPTGTAGSATAGTAATAAPTIIRLGDVAKVAEGSSPVNGISRTDGVASLQIQVIRDTNGNAVTLSDDVKSRMAKLKLYPSDQLQLTSDAADDIRASLKDLLLEGLIGALLAVVVIFLFLRSVRATLVTAVSLPTSVLVALLGTNLGGFSLNALTLAGLTIAVGRIVDDAIVVLENSYRHLQQGEPPRLAALNGATEVSSAVISSTLTTVAVFLPIGLVGGIISRFFLPFSVTVTISLLASLLVALTLIPVLVSFFLQHRVSQASRPARSNWLVRLYTPVLSWALSRRLHKFAVLGLALVLLVGSLSTLALVPKDFFAFGGSEQLEGSVTLPPGTSTQQTSDKLKQFEAAAMKDPAVQIVQVTIASSDYGAYTGAFSTNQARLNIRLKSKSGADAVAKRLKAKLDQLYGAGNALLAVQQAGPPSSGFTASASGRDPAALRQASDMIVANLSKDPDLINVKSDLSAEQPQLLVTVDPAKAASNGLTPQIVAFAVSGALSPKSVGTLGPGGPTVTLLVDPSSISADRLKDLPLARGVTLKDVASINTTLAPTAINRVDGTQQVTVSAAILPADTQGASNTATARLTSLKLPTGVKLDTGGTTTDINDSFNQMFIAIGVAIGIVFLILVTFFRSIVTPFVILLTMPLALIGGLLALFLSRLPLGLPALLGVLLVFGIVVSNAILLIDFVERNRAGHSLTEALMRAGRVRLRPIVMTAVATIVALVPVAVGLSTSGGGGLISQSLAVVVEGGLVSSTFLTLIVIPVVYSLLKRRGRKPPEQANGHREVAPGAVWEYFRPRPEQPVP
jgi:hydrophobic/amphiphilic exporter-1 (mainly G- bacteria), HAE1 family